VSEEEIQAFKSHPRSFEKNLYAYPVLSRRARGLSVGINLSPHKACNMDCVYCQVDRAIKPAVRTVDLDVMERELTELLVRAATGEIFTVEPFAGAPSSLHRLADVAFSGDGEPTSYRDFHEACRRAVRAKTAAGVPETPVRVITNAIDLDREEVVKALAYLDEHGGEIWAKLDAGTEEYFDRVARTKTSFEKVLGNLEATAKLRPLTIQSLFMRLYGIDPPREEIDAFVGRLEGILAAGGGLALVQVHTVARPPAESFVSGVDRSLLEEIAKKVTARTGVPAEVYS
jgi:wyosine [tRNA(Phe)-imidazoG37] synthetase (radical SAM superfamily)